MNWQRTRLRHVVAARQYAREIAAAIGYDSQDQTRIATAVSEATGCFW
jgi:anti-sigma regulatory factor (Ser/Thr protein kinase)